MHKWIKWGFWGGLVGIVAIILAVVIATSTRSVKASSSEQSTDATRTITVTGIGQATGTPDVAYIDLGVDLTDSDPSKVFSQANDTIAQVKDAVLSAGVAKDGIQTVNFSMWAQNNTDSSGAPAAGRTYHVQNTLRITVSDIATVGDVINAAVDAGANSIGSLNFGMADPSALAGQARMQAIADAKTRAGQLAEALGVQIGDPVTISEAVANDTSPRMAFAASAVGSGGASVSGGQLTVSVQVDVTFAINS